MSDHFHDKQQKEWRGARGPYRDDRYNGTGITRTVIQRIVESLGVIFYKTLSNALDRLGTVVHGAIIYRGASYWVPLNPHAPPDELPLISLGSGSNPLFKKLPLAALANDAAVHGTVLFHNATRWVELAPGTDGDVLTTHDVGADPTWEAAGGSGGSPTGPAGGDLTGTYPDPTISTSVLTAAARTVTDDATVAAMVETLGGAPSTGTGGLVRTTSATLVTPLLGTPTSGTLTNCTGLPVSTGVSGLGAGSATFLATPTSANLAAAVTDETGTGALVFATSPTLVTPLLGTPTSGTLTNCTGLPIATGVSGLGGGIATFLATPSSANLISAVTDETGSGALVFATSPQLVTPKLGTPHSAVLTNCTGLPISTGVSGLAAGIATFLATPTSANLAAAVTNETGSGLLVFATSPTLTTPLLGTPTSGVLTNCTGLPRGGMTDGTALSVIGRSGGTNGVVADIAATAAGDGVMRESGGTIGWGQIQLGKAWLPSDECVYHEEFMTSTLTWAQASGSGGGAYSTTATSGHPGIYRLGAGGTSGGYVAIYSTTGAVVFAGTLTWEGLVYITNDATGAKVRCGFADGYTTSDPANGVFFEYAKASSANWRIRTANASTYTTTTSGTAVAFNAWLKLKITFDGTTATFYVNGTSIGTSTTNIPTAVVAPSFFVTHSTASAYTTVDVDYSFLRMSSLAR